MLQLPNGAKKMGSISTSSGDTLRRKVAGALGISKGRLHRLNQQKQ